MENLIRKTKHKSIMLDAENLKNIADTSADVLMIPMLKQVTITFSFPDKTSAEEFFGKFKEKEWG